MGFVCALVTVPASAQTTWVWSEAILGKQNAASDALELNGQTFVTTIQYDGLTGNLPGASRLAILDGTGMPSSLAPLTPSEENVKAYFLVRNGSGEESFVGGACDESGSRGIFVMRVGLDGNVLSQTVRTYPGMNYTMALNGAALLDGGLVVGGAGAMPFPGPLYNRAILLKVDADGQIVNDTIYGISPDGATCRQVVEWNGNIWFTVDGGGLDEFEGSGGIRAFRINEDLAVDQWFTMTYFDQHPEPPFDSIPREPLDLVPISQSRFASSGRFGGIQPPMARAALSISDTTGALIRGWLPRSTYPMDFTPFLQGVSKSSSGDLYFAMHENAQVGPPSTFSVFEPNRIHVYKLDTSLNVLCEHILDGFAENAYYYLNRIKATDDGGFLLLGGRRDFNDPSGYFAAWAQKFGPDDCVVGLTERPSSEAAIFPNPGREGFTLMLSGEATNGTLLVLDALGRAVGSAPIRQGQARFVAAGLAPGAYLYRALDAHGVPRASGRWVKE